MSNLPDFTAQGYEVIRELGYSSAGGRITYLATDLRSQEEVVIKTFCFWQKNADWMGYKAHEREIEVLQQLNHPRIPRYLGSFLTDNGFCLIQQYKDAPSLAQKHDFQPKEIKQIALSVLEILEYLQEKREPVFHRDIKPENILVAENLEAYLIDFGFAKVDHNNSLAASSLMGGTLGFMPNEQLYEDEENKVNKSSDLYSLGMTIICLLTQTPSSKVGQFVFKGINFKEKLPSLHPDFLKWLKKMIASESKDRFYDAKSARNQLQSLRVDRPLFSEKLKNGFKSSCTIFIRQRQKILIIILAGIGGGILTIGCVKLINYIAEHQKLKAERIAEQERLKNQREDNKQHLFLAKKCPTCYLQRANLEGANLEGANLQRANLEGANLADADLQRADLLLANLQYANLQRAKLQKANVKWTNLEWANLKGADLEGADLEKANLKKADLEWANLLYADLQGTNLQRAKLQDANLHGTNLQDANLQGTNLQGTNLQTINLQSANLQGAGLGYADLQRANLKGADLGSADLLSANLKGADLLYANLQNADLQRANLYEANLYEANLYEANLYEANLESANLQNAKSQNAKLQNAKLQGANLKGATLKGAELKNANFANAIMPDGTVYEEWVKRQ